MDSWTLEEMRAMQLPTTAWSMRDGGRPEPVLLRSVTARKSPTERVIVYATSAAHFATVPVDDVLEGKVRFYPERPGE